jgi:hypothetical protein
MPLRAKHCRLCKVILGYTQRLFRKTSKSIDLYDKIKLTKVNNTKGEVRSELKRSQNDTLKALKY